MSETAASGEAAPGGNDKPAAKASPQRSSAITSITATSGRTAIVRMAGTLGVLLLVAAVGVFLALKFVDQERERELQRWQVRLGIIADSRHADVREWLNDQLTEVSSLADNEALQLYLTLIAEAGGSVGDTPEAGFLRNLLAVVGDRAGFKGEIQGAEVSANVSRVGSAGLALIDKTGTILVNTTGFPPIREDLKSFLDKVPPATRAVSDIYVGPTGKPSMAFVAPIFQVQSDQTAENQIGMVVGVKVFGDELYPRLKQPGNVDKSAEAVLVRKRGTVIDYLSPLQDGTQPLQLKLSTDTTDLDAAFALENPGGFGIKKDYRGEEVLVTSRAFDLVPWVLMYKIDTSESLAESEERLRGMIIAFFGIIALLVIGMVAIWFKGTSKRASESAERFEKLAERFQGQRNFMHLVTDNQPNAIVVLDNKGHYRWFNQKALEDSGVARQDLFDKHVMSILGPQDGRRIERWVQDTIEQQKPMTQTHEMIVRGHERIYRSDLIPLEARDGMAPGVLMVSQDITETIRERQQRERVLHQLVASLVSVVDRRDPFSANHSMRVGMVARATADEMGLDPVDIETAEFAAKLMNLGKITVPTEVLTKRERLTEAEIQMIRDSVLTSAEIVERIEFGGPVAETIRQIQENYDGSGIPEGRKGDDILLPARIVAAANAFVGMVSARSWRPGLDFEKAVEVLLGGVGKSFDRRVVAALVNHLDNGGGREAWREFGEPPRTDA